MRCRSLRGASSDPRRGTPTSGSQDATLLGGAQRPPDPAFQMIKGKNSLSGTGTGDSHHGQRTIQRRKQFDATNLLSRIHANKHSG
jgi:hypothetical protein